MMYLSLKVALRSITVPILLLTLLLMPLRGLSNETWWCHPTDPAADYSTYQSCEDAKNGDMSGRGVVTCEGYGGDLGWVTVFGGSNQDSSNYFRLYVPPQQRGVARIDQSTTYGILIYDDHFMAEGVDINMGAGSNTGIVFGNGPDGVVVAESVITCNNAAAYYPLSFSVSNGTATGMVLKSNVIYGNGHPYYGIYTSAWAQASDATLALSAYNNTVDNIQYYGFYFYEIAGAGTATLNHTIENNVSTNGGYGAYGWSVANGAITSNNNASDDASADDKGGSDHLINQTDTDMFVTVGSDHHLKAGSNLIGAGKAVGGVDTDADGKEIPQGSSYDIGGFVDPLTATKAEVITAGVAQLITDGGVKQKEYDR